MRLLEGAPSVPILTHIFFASISGTRAKPKYLIAATSNKIPLNRVTSDIPPPFCFSFMRKRRPHLPPLCGVLGEKKSMGDKRYGKGMNDTHAT